MENWCTCVEARREYDHTSGHIDTVGRPFAAVIKIVPRVPVRVLARVASRVATVRIVAFRVRRPHGAIDAFLALDALVRAARRAVGHELAEKTPWREDAAVGRRALGPRPRARDRDGIGDAPGEVAVELLSIIKHPLHVRDFGHVPGAQVGVELDGIVEHKAHGRDF